MTSPARLLDPADEVVRWIRRDHPHVSRRNLRQWADRGHITRHPGDLYDAVEVADYLDGRSVADRNRAAGVARCAASRRLR